jgi:flagellar biosynthesis protein
MASQPDTRPSAVALAYNAGDAAPRVVAKGRGLIADEIVSRARQTGVFVHESPEMVALLMQVDLDARIPTQLYVAVAELLAWIYQLEREVSAPTQPAADASTEPSAPPGDVDRQAGQSRSPA